MKRTKQESKKWPESKNVLLTQQAQSGNRAAFDQLVNQHYKLVHHMVKKYRKKPDYDDYVQMGSIGLMNAIKGFDPTKNVKFATYACHMISGWARMHQDSYNHIKIPRRAISNAYKIKLFQEKQWASNGREASHQTIKETLELTEEEFVAATDAYNYISSLDFELENQGQIDTVNLLEVTSDETSFEEKIDNTLFIQSMMGKLDDQEKIVINCRYMLEEKQSTIAERLGLKQSQVSRLEKRALEKMKTNHLHIS